MSRGVAELMSHYRTEGHSVKEHRIRIEIPGMPHFDRNYKEYRSVRLKESQIHLPNSTTARPVSTFSKSGLSTQFRQPLQSS